jgi:ubiquinone/menaquinone biosynthesis C-methylase UbiE
MRRPEFIARQARCPSGVLGHVLARVMAVETAGDNQRAVKLLDPTPSDAVLEIGFGHGRTISRLAAMAAGGFVGGVEISPRMVEMARRFNRRAIAEGRVELERQEGPSIPYDDGRFDKVLSVHTLYFWSDPLHVLGEIRRVTKPGGRLVLGFRGAEDERVVNAFPASVYRFYTSAEVRRLLETCRFRDVRLVGADGDPGEVVFAVAERD